MTTETVCVPRDELSELLEDGVDDCWVLSESGVRIVGTLRALLAQPVASEPVAWLLTDQGQIAADDFEDFIRFELAEEIPEGELKRFLDAGRAEPLYRHPPAPAVPDGWILLSERLPEIGTEVLVYCPHKIEASRNPVTALVRLIRHEAAAEFYWDNNYGGSNIHLQESVTHWMPLPAAPQPTEGSTDE